MNIFFLSWYQGQCAKWHCDQHCIKMIVEYAQLLSTAHRYIDGKIVIVKSKSGRRLKQYMINDEIKDFVLYKSTHINHPCAIWVRESSENYMWLYRLFCELCDEYTRRYNKIHLTDTKLRKILILCPNGVKIGKITTPPLAMPDEYKSDYVIESYRMFYKYSKTRFATWKVEKPWFI